jgi:hypothetical protein
MAESLSYAQCLRVIGQDLDALGVDFFELAKWGDDYIVWLERTEFTKKLSAEKGFLSKITQKILGHEDSARERFLIIYTLPLQISFGQIRRGD